MAHAPVERWFPAYRPLGHNLSVELDVWSSCHFSDAGCKDSKASVPEAVGAGGGPPVLGIWQAGTFWAQKISPKLPDLALLYLTIRQILCYMNS